MDKHCIYCDNIVENNLNNSDHICNICLEQKKHSDYAECDHLLFPKNFMDMLYDLPCSTSIIGYLKIINFIDNKFTVDYGIKEWNTTEVFFNEEANKKIIPCINERVEVKGNAYYKKDVPRPYKMNMHSIRKIVVDPNAPKLSEMWGCMPDITGGKSVQEYLDDIRRDDAEDDRIKKL